jgi:hypothetical protein
MNAHTDGPLIAQTEGAAWTLWSRRDVRVAIMANQPTDEANARRLVAAWNACVGLSTEEIEAEGSLVTARVGTIETLVREHDELVAALRNLLDAHDSAIHASGRQRAYEAEETARTLLAQYPETA